MRTTSEEVRFVRDFWDALRFMEIESIPISNLSFTQGVEALVTEYRRDHSDKELSAINVHLFYRRDGDLEYPVFEEILADTRDRSSTYLRESRESQRVFLDKPYLLLRAKPESLRLAVAFCEGSGTEYDKRKMGPYLETTPNNPKED